MGVAASHVRMRTCAKMTTITMQYLEGGAIVTACQAVGLPIPRAPRPRRTVMTSPYACVLCHRYDHQCTQLYVDHCWGWIVCPACRHLAHLGWTRHFQEAGCVPAHAVLPPRPRPPPRAAADGAGAHSLPVRFYRQSRGAVQPGWIAPWLLLGGFVHVLDTGEVLFMCHFDENGEKCDTPDVCAFHRGVSVINLACHNGGAAWTALVRGVHARLWVSDHLVWSVRRRWCRALRRQFRAGCALRAAAPALRARLPPEVREAVRAGVFRL